jgi:hypothetical protein
MAVLLPSVASSAIEPTTVTTAVLLLDHVTELSLTFCNATSASRVPTVPRLFSDNELGLRFNVEFEPFGIWHPMKSVASDTRRASTGNRIEGSYINF